MENEEIVKVEEKVKVKRKYTIPLILIGIVVAVLVAGYFLLFIGGVSSKKFYLTAIDTLSSNISDIIDENEDFIEDPMAIDGNLSVELANVDDSMKSIADIANKIKLNINMEMDYKNKAANATYNITHDNADLIKANAILNNDGAYVKLEGIYAKYIKMPLEDMELLWASLDYSEYDTINDELTKILKNNLKDEYFVTDKEKMNVDGKAINTLKLTLQLSDKDLETFVTNVLNDVESNEKLMNALSKISNTKIDDLKENIKTIKDAVEFDGGIKIITNVNKLNKEIIKVTVTNDKDEFTLVRSTKNKYDIIIKDDNDSNVVGNLEVTNNKLGIEINQDEVKINYTLEKNKEDYDMNLKVDANGDSLEFSLKGNNDKGNGYIKVNSSSLTLDVKVNLDYEVKDIKSVSKTSVDNYVEYDKLTENDYNFMMQNIYKNTAMMSILGSLM